MRTRLLSSQRAFESDIPKVFGGADYEMTGSFVGHIGVVLGSGVGSLWMGSTDMTYGMESGYPL